MKYISVTIETTSEAADIIAIILMDEGTEGVSILDPADFDYIKERVYWDYASDSMYSSDKVFVTGVFDVDKDIESIKNAVVLFKENSEIPTGSLKMKISELDSQDYEDEWKKYYKIIEIESFAVVPSWLEYSGNKPFIKINPGKAFGTGSHETTSMCLRLLQDLDLNGKKVIDVGCGSGILGLSALRLNAELVYMSDIDIQAVEAANENASLNNLENKARIVLWGEKEIDEFFSTNEKIITFKEEDKADICLANLTADILLSLKPNINKLLKKGGNLIISGIINSRVEEIKSAFSDLTMQKNICDGEWQAFSFTL